MNIFIYRFWRSCRLSGRIIDAHVWSLYESCKRVTWCMHTDIKVVIVTRKGDRGMIYAQIPWLYYHNLVMTEAGWCEVVLEVQQTPVWLYTRRKSPLRY